MLDVNKLCCLLKYPVIKVTERFTEAVTSALVRGLWMPTNEKERESEKGKDREMEIGEEGEGKGIGGEGKRVLS